MKTYYRRLSIVCHDLLVVLIAWYMAYLTRFNFSLEATHAALSWQSMAAVFAVQAVLMWFIGLSRGLWRFASLSDLWNIVRFAVLGTLAAFLVLFLFNRLEGIPRTALIFYPMYLVFLLGAPRMLFRVIREHGQSSLKDKKQEKKRVLLVGAGRAGELLCRDMRRTGEYKAIGFLDDNRHLKGTKVHGVPVLGAIDKLVDAAEEKAADFIMIAVPSASSREMQRVVEYCEESGVEFRTLPRLIDLVSGESALQGLREVKIEDLLGRDPVQLDWNKLSHGIAERSVLVTGAGGSIGSELCRQIARLAPSVLVLLDQSEFNLYKIEHELNIEYPNLKLRMCLADVCDHAAVERAMKDFQPDYIFHAAAYKHVPMLEHQSREAVRNNVLGTRCVAKLADKYKVRKFVMISTDKAVNPANVMGATKRVSEIFCQTLNKHSATEYITVRFGNVLGSAGSVVPLFRKQIEKGGPITVTHPDILRYFMTIPEASQLILQAAVMGDGGEIYVLDMGKPIKIAYLAEQMIRLSGKVPEQDIKIEYIGLRPGEKLYEELFYDKENLVPTHHEKILLANSLDINWNTLNSQLEKMQEACDAYEEEDIQVLLNSLVPELNAERTKTANNIINLDKARAK